MLVKLPMRSKTRLNSLVRHQAAFKAQMAPDESPVLAPAKIIALDEGGVTMGSTAFARLIESWRDSGVREARFLIGAADGLSAEDRASADLIWSFGAMTWPHLLVRAMLCEQLYRATSIIAGHPYHREG